ncbi:unnamed protein product [Fraxinus pennsylvanica]|uniref:Dirigent protein n=1 Tax=Fraxinus pennsylvanica TaxID=56036 RepID=A0AAD2DZ10_9LAMI|nr:unnamed protein product [Fraxinus pennsylvanica]
MLCSLVIISTAAAAGGLKEGPEAVEKWFEKLTYAKEKLTKLHFYFYDTCSRRSFKRGPEPESKIMGRAQGIYGSDSLEELGILMILNLAFTDVKYNGSTLSVLGHNPFLHEYREMPIVGGSSVFRLARGIATAQTVWYNLTTNNAVVEYTIMVLHY